MIPRVGCTLGAVVVLLSSALAMPSHAQTSGGEGTITRGIDATSINLEAYEYTTPQANSAEAISTSHTNVGGSELPLEPQARYVDSLCGMVTDIEGEFQATGPILRGETSGCLLPAPVEVADAPRGRGPRAPQPPSPTRIMDRVIALVAAPELELAPSEIGLTGLETYVWVERPAPVSVTAAAGATTVEARATASQYLWDWGDGDDTLTYSPGRAWSRYAEGSIGHVYETRGRYDLSVEVVWEAQWRINGGAWQGLGFFSLSDSVDYPVRQVQARLTRTTD